MARSADAPQAEAVCQALLAALRRVLLSSRGWFPADSHWRSAAVNGLEIARRPTLSSLSKSSRARGSKARTKADQRSLAFMVMQICREEMAREAKAVIFIVTSRATRTAKAKMLRP